MNDTDDNRTLYVCPKVASCPFKDCSYHRVYRRANASGWWNERTCPKEGVPLDTLVVVVEEEPA